MRQITAIPVFDRQSQAHALPVLILSFNFHIVQRFQKVNTAENELNYIFDNLLSFSKGGYGLIYIKP